MIELITKEIKHPKEYGFSEFHKVNIHKIEKLKELDKIKEDLVIISGGQLNYEIISI